jgi:hypothetical protein
VWRVKIEEDEEFLASPIQGEEVEPRIYNNIGG